MTMQKTKKTKIKPEYAQWIHKHLETPTKRLVKQTGLSIQLIELIKKAKRNNFWKQGHKGGNKSTFDKLTDEMKEFLRSVEFDTWWDLKVKFNRRFRMSEITPIHDQTLRNYYKRLTEQEV